MYVCIIYFYYTSTVYAKILKGSKKDFTIHNFRRLSKYKRDYSHYNIQHTQIIMYIVLKPNNYTVSIHIIYIARNIHVHTVCIYMCSTPLTVLLHILLMHGFFSLGLRQNLHERHLGALQPSQILHLLRFFPEINDTCI